MGIHFNRSYISIAIMMLLISFCEPEDTVRNLVEGSWRGTIGERSLLITFIEGRFEGSATLGGSCVITTDSSYADYLIMNGTHNQIDRITFALYSIPVEGTEAYEMSGTVDGRLLEGTYTRKSGIETVESGTWQAERIP